MAADREIEQKAKVQDVQRDGQEAIPKWKLEREAFVKAMRVSKQIQKLEQDPAKDNVEN